jgi:hypothetical protein
MIADTEYLQLLTAPHFVLCNDQLTDAANALQPLLWDTQVPTLDLVLLPSRPGSCVRSV